MNKRFQPYLQLDQMDCGPTCLRMIAKHFGRHYSAQTLRDKAQISRSGVSMLGIAEAAENIGLKTVGVKVNLDKLIEQAPLPCILHWGQNHFVVLHKIERTRQPLSKQLLSMIWGGRKSPTCDAPDQVYGSLQSYKNNEIISQIEKETDETFSFHIADPSTGLLVYTESEFRKKWISSLSGGMKEGIALLIETTPDFFNEEGERVKGLNISQLFAYLWNYKTLLMQLGLGLVVESGLSLLIPILTQSVVDVGIGTQNLSFVYIVLIAQMVLLFSTSAVSFVRSWILLHISVRLNLTILSEFLSKLMRLPLSFFDVKQFGDIMQRIGDHHRIESFLTGQTIGVIFSIFNLFVFGIMLAFYHWTIFTVAIGASVLYTLWVLLFLQRRRKLDTKRFEIASRNQSQIVQLIQGMQDIKLAGAEISKRWAWEKTQAKLFKWNIANLSLSQTQQVGALLINNGKNIFITFLSAKAVINGDLSLGGMMSVQFILGQFNSPIEQMITFLQSWQDAQLSLERLNEVHGLPDEESKDSIARKDWDPTMDIRFEGVTYTYPGAGNTPVLHNINLTLPSGKTTAIVGTSGSGKTTLLKLLLRFYEPQNGSISLISKFKIPLKNISHQAWRRQCGVVMQEGFLFSDSIARNIAVSDEIIDTKRLRLAATTANIHDFIESLPLSYHTKIGSDGNGLSQGQKQRILIARSVYKNPGLLLFDEATNSLDASNEAVILKNLTDFFQNRTVVVVAHRLSTVKNAHQIVVLDKGEIVEIGTHRELILLKGKYYELVSNQLELSVP